MCGIFGSVNCEQPRAISLLNHRGPDSNGLYTDDNLTLGHLRLSILDLSDKGHQPMGFEQFIITFNGEIYNYKEIRIILKKNGYSFQSNTDTEVILKAYHFWGDTCVEKFNGMWAFCIYNKRDKTLFISRDRIGIKPLYYGVLNGKFAFASEIKGLPNEFKQERDNKALIQLTSLSYIPAPNSWYKSIKKLEPGNNLIYNLSNNKIKINKYWSLPQNKIKINFNEAVEEVEYLLIDAVKKRLVADVEIGSFLSGGIDSSLITAIAQKEFNKQLKTFTIGFENKKYDESNYAKKIAKYLDTNHHEYIFTSSDVLDIITDYDYYYDEPFGNASALPTMLLSKFTKQHVSVALSGDGGDELFLGYERYNFTTNYYKKLNLIPQFIRSGLSTVMNMTSHDKLLKMAYPIKHLNHENLLSVIYTSIKPWDLEKIFPKQFIKDAFNKDNITLFDLLNLPNSTIKTEKELSQLDINRNLPDSMLTKVDRASMKYALEVRVPLLDHRIIEFASTIPQEILLQGGLKSILKTILSKYIPDELFNRQKKGFSVPLKYWYRNELKNKITTEINSLPECFNKNYTNNILDAHLNKNHNFESLLWNLSRINNINKI